MDFDLATVGGGPAGLMAAGRAAARGRRVMLLEKNRRPGVKILMAGGTRCNLTHDTDARGIVAAFGPSGRFLHSALAALGPREVVEFFTARGVPTYVEEGGKVFPRSDRSADVLEALLAAARQSGAMLAGSETVRKIEAVGADAGFCVSTNSRRWTARNVLIATGGCSYPACGTTGDGYELARAFGHTIVPPRTALVPLTTHAAWVTDLQGLTIPDAAVRVIDPEASPKRSPAESRAALLFTHFGLSGPAAMNVSRAVSAAAGGQWPVLECDFLPDVPAIQLESALAAALRAEGKRQASTVVAQWLPHRLADALVAQALGDDSRAAEVSKEGRQRLVAAMKRAAIPLSGTLGFKKAEVTAGGVALAEVDSRTMQSKLVPGLFFAGEVLDLDGPIGGFNFQAAFSTGFLAGESV